MSCLLDLEIISLSTGSAWGVMRAHHTAVTDAVTMVVVSSTVTMVHGRCTYVDLQFLFCKYPEAENKQWSVTCDVYWWCLLVYNMSDDWWPLDNGVTTHRDRGPGLHPVSTLPRPLATFSLACSGCDSVSGPNTYPLIDMLNVEMLRDLLKKSGHCGHLWAKKAEDLIRTASVSV